MYRILRGDIFRHSSVRLAVFTGIAFLLFSVIITAFFHYHERKVALDEARAKALIILNRNLATHAYFNEKMKPALFELTDPLRRPEYFDPVWMSSTYAIREIDRIYQSMNREGYYYKECAINARTPANEADDFEKEFIQKLNSDPKHQELSGVRKIEGKPFFYVLVRGEKLENTCLRCHSVPTKAPGGLVEKYGDKRSFNRKEGEIISAISIRIPLAAAYENADKFALRLSGLILTLLIILLSAQLWFTKRIIFSPLAMMRNKALQIISARRHLGEEIPVPQGRELESLAISFNAMSKSLKQTLDGLEARVRERTAELSDMNTSLQNEISERKAVEAEREELISELSSALLSVKTLRGMLPICASCKKIRDDKGYWEEVSSYLSKHSDASFTHGICPDCLKKAYDELDDMKHEKHEDKKPRD